MKALQPIQAVLLGMLIIGLAVVLFSSGYDIGKNIADRERAGTADVR